MAIDLTGISNVNEFYSHHYLDSLLEGDLKGLFKKWQEQEERSPYEKLSGVTQKYFRAKKEAFDEKKPEDRVEITQNFHGQFLSILGYTVIPNTKFTEDGHAIPVLMSEKRDGNEYVWALETVFWEDDISIFEQPFVLMNKDEEMNWLNESVDSAIQQIFRLDDPPRWIILLAGQKVYLIDRNKWGQGKYLLFDLDELFGRKQADTLKATSALLAKDSLAPEEGNILHDELDEKSHKHAFSVSEDLKYGIRRAVELIGNEYIYYHSKINKQKLYGDEELAGRLTKECLTYLYRLLFLFYAESRSEELNVVPMKSEEYRIGYSLETIRDLEQVPLTTKKSMEGYYIHQSLTTLFKIVNEGFGNNEQVEMDIESGKYLDYGFEIDGLQSPLFDPKQTPLLSSVKFRNFVLQEVIQLLSLSKEGSKQRGRISYAQLGINQLGAVYEGLLSYSGFFAQETMYEVKPADVSSTDETGQSYFVSESEIEQYKAEEFVLIVDEDGSKKRKKYEKGSFIFRLAGRDREKSASYYTPEVLTKSLVKYSLKELLKNKNADDILELSICEPAMGSGAFLNEVINQLADAYLERKQKDLGISINPERYSHEKQRVKAYLATNNIYGVDLNATAVELAKVSFWLNTIYEGSKTPWFSARLAEGNSLIGARKLVYHAEDLISGKWNNLIPEKQNFDQKRFNNTIYHFLVPDKGMMAFDNDKVVKELVNGKFELMKNWQTEFNQKFDSNEISSLIDISGRIDELWIRHTKNRIRLLEITKEKINVWGKETNTLSEETMMVKEKEEKLKEIKDSPTSPYRIIKMIMDYWCALWIWPIDKVDLLPTRSEYILDLNVILDSVNGFGTNINDLINTVDRLKVVTEIARENNFIHWELEFSEVYFTKRGFDLIIGNPPWIKLLWEEKGILSENAPLLSIRKNTASTIANHRKDILKHPTILREYLREYTNISGQKIFLNSYLYNVLKGVQTNLYKNFIILSLEQSNENGIVSFIHQEGIYDDPKSDNLRDFLYPKLRYHFHYINELMLFSEVGHPVKFGCSIFSSKIPNGIGFYNISNLFHPKTIDECFNGGSQGDVPGLKDKEYKWEVKGHKSRIIWMDKDLLSIINTLFEDSKKKIEHTKLINIHSIELVNVLRKLSQHKNKLVCHSNDVYDTEMFHETNDQKKDTIRRETYFPPNISDLVLSGPHFFVSNPLYQTPNENCKSHGDYSRVNLLKVKEDYLPRTNYKIKNKDTINFKWDGNPITDFNRIIFRKMINSNLERTLVGAIIPKGPSHINGCLSYAIKDSTILTLFSGMTSSIVIDFYIKITGKSNLGKVIYNLPVPSKDHPLSPYVINRVLRLNCLTSYYAELWNEMSNKIIKGDNLVKKDPRIKNFSGVSSTWSKSQVYLNDLERRQALIELDVIVALMLDLRLDELLTIYKIQFSVLQKYENFNYYDQQGMVVPNSVLKFHEKCEGNIDITNLEGYIPPFDQFSRESEMREAYEHFSKIINSTLWEENK